MAGPRLYSPTDGRTRPATKIFDVIFLQRIDGDSLPASGRGHFESITGEVVNVLLWIATKGRATAGDTLVFLDASDDDGVKAKQVGVTRRPPDCGRPRRSSPHAGRADSQAAVIAPSSYADSPMPIRASRLATIPDGGDFWELASTWAMAAVANVSLAETPTTGVREHARLRGDDKTSPNQASNFEERATWGNRGVAVSQMVALRLPFNGSEVRSERLDDLFRSMRMI